MFSRKLKRLDPLSANGFAPTRLDELQDGRGISLGRFSDGRICSLPIVELSKSAIITGSPGSGKTTATASIARQLLERGVGVVVFEPAKNEYAQLLGVPASRTFGYDSLRVNPFAVDPGVRINSWIERVTMCMQDAYAVTQEESGRIYLEGLIRRLYRTREIDADAIATGCEPWPTVRDFLLQAEPYMAEETCSGGEVRSNIQGYLVSRGRAMASCAGLRSSGTGLLGRDLSGCAASVVRISDFGYGSGRFLAMILLLRIIECARADGARPQHTAVILEEAHSLFEDGLTGAPTMFGFLYTSALAELRSSGTGFITVDQRASLLPGGCIANSATKLCFSCSHGDDRDQVGASLGLTDGQAARLGALGPGQALFTTQGRAGAEAVRTMGG